MQIFTTIYKISCANFVRSMNSVHLILYSVKKNRKKATRTTQVTRVPNDSENIFFCRKCGCIYDLMHVHLIAFVTS